MHAAKLAGLTTVPAIIKEMTDDEAVIAMVDSNMQREEILLSERAFSLKMKMDAMRRQGYRADLNRDRSSNGNYAAGEGTCGTECHKLKGELMADKKAREEVGAKWILSTPGVISIRTGRMSTRGGAIASMRVRTTLAGASTILS